MQDELQNQPVTITEEEYGVLIHERGVWVSYGRFYANLNGLSSKIHFTFVWKLKENDLVLLHANANHAKPMPVDAPQSKMFEKIDETPKTNQRSSADPKQKIRICIRDTDGNLHYMPAQDILYARSESKYCTVHLADESKFIARKNISDLVQEPLIRIHKQYIVNPFHIHTIRRYAASLYNGEEIPIGKESYKLLTAFLMQEKN